MNFRQILFTILAMFASLHTAQAGDITVRNKTIHDVTPLWVAEYSVGASKAERVAGPWQIFSEDERTWDKSANVAFKERWVRWAVKKSDLDGEYSKSDWDNVGGDIGKKSIGSFVGNINISDYNSKGTYQAKTDTGEWIASAWRGTWDSIWGPLSTAGDSLEVHNETGKTQYFCEYQQKPFGVATKMQGPFTVAAGATKTITKKKLDPGYTERFIYFKDINTFGESGDYEYWPSVGNKKEGDGKSIGKLYLYADKNGDPRAYNNTEWKFKKMGCKLLTEAVDIAGKAMSKVALPDGVTKAIGLDAIMKPVEDTIANIASNALNLTELQTQINAQLGPKFGSGNIAKMRAVQSKLVQNASQFEDLFDASCFCEADKDNIHQKLQNMGLKITDWTNLVPADATGKFHQGFSMTTSFAYKNLSVAFTKSIITDFANDFKVIDSLSVSAGTTMEKVPKVTLSPSVEFYPHCLMADFNGGGWSIGVSGNFSGLPSTGLSFMFSTTTPPLPDFTKLSGIGISAGASSGTASFSAAGGYGTSWAAF